MGVLVFGDLHIDSKIKYKKNPFFEGDSLKDYRSIYTLKHIYDTVNTITTKKGDNNLDIVFLGDIYDQKNTGSNKGYVQFGILLDKILLMFKDAINGIFILVGNHDTEEYGSVYGTLLSLLSMKEGKVFIFHEPTVIESKNYFFFPYVPKEKISETLSKMNLNKNYIMFSHLDISLNDEVFNIPTFNFSEFQGNFTKIFNGHIHKHYIVDLNFINVGATTPWRFNENEVGSGTIYFNDNMKGLDVFRNQYVYYIDVLDITSLSEIQKKLDIINTFPQKIVYIRFSKNIPDEIIKNILNSYKFIIEYTFKKEDKVNTGSELSVNDVKTIMTQKIASKLKEGDDEIDLNNMTDDKLKVLFKNYIKRKYKGNKLLNELLDKFITNN